MTTLAGLLARVEVGERLPTDPWLSLVPAPAPGRAAVLSFPGHVVIAADLDPDWIRGQLPDRDLSAVWAQVTPGNAASVRAFLAAGYRPVGAEALLVA
jgi:hypothetical protein